MKRFFQLSVKWVFITFILFIPFYFISVWITGPLSQIEEINQEKLKKLYEKSAFENCHILDYKSLQNQNDLAQCLVNDNEVWLLLNNEQDIVDRINLNQSEQEGIRLKLMQMHQAKDVLFSYYQDQFVYHILKENEELFISILDERILLSVKIKNE